MSSYATREDGCCAAAVFVDLHRLVRQGLRASVESYSIKHLEPFYGFARAVDLATATRALIQVEAWLESGDTVGVPDRLRLEIEGYNRDDCLSTLRLAAWLEERRRELQGLTGQPVPRPTLRGEARDQEQEPAVETAPLFEALTAGLPVDAAELDDEQRARWLLAHLLEFHRREDKSMWWEFFHRCGFTEEEHVESRATLGALTCEGEAGQVKRSVIHRYRFPDQPHEVKVGDSPKNPDTAESDELKRGFCGTVVALDETGGTIDLKRGRSSPVPHPAALVPLDNVPNTVLRESLARLAEAVVSGGFAADSPRRAAFDLLGRVPPRIEPPAFPPNAAGFGVRDGLVAQGEAPLDAVQRIAPRLDRSVLPVQGPPGSGKTYTGARMIPDLLDVGRRVGVTANSHKVISNLLAAVCDAADEPPSRTARPVASRTPDPDGKRRSTSAGSRRRTTATAAPTNASPWPAPTTRVAEVLAAGDANLAAGTAWLWAREEMAGTVDVLVIDEAGQMSLANTLAVCQAAGSLVLLGDPRQLDQPIQGVHPPGADVSALSHLLGESATVDPSRGVFLDQTWRMHPDICAFTTEQFYEGRLRPQPELRRQTVVGPGPLAGHGLRFIPVAHAGNTNTSAGADPGRPPRPRAVGRGLWLSSAPRPNTKPGATSCPTPWPTPGPPNSLRVSATSHLEALDVEVPRGFGRD